MTTEPKSVSFSSEDAKALSGTTVASLLRMPPALVSRFPGKPTPDPCPSAKAVFPPGPSSAMQAFNLVNFVQQSVPLKIKNTQPPLFQSFAIKYFLKIQNLSTFRRPSFSYGNPSPLPTSAPLPLCARFNPFP